MRISRRGRNAPDASRGGWALLFAVFAAFVAASSVALVLTRSATTSKNSQLGRSKQEARYVALGAVEVAKKNLLNSVANFVPAPYETQIAVGNHLADTVMSETGFTAVETEPSGIQTLVTGWEVESSVTVDRSYEEAHRLVNVEATPIFQFAVFYDNDLEILPGPDMTLGGRVHTNGNMYLGSGNTLTVDTNYCRAVGGIYRHRKNDPSRSSGTVSVRQWVANPYDPSEPAQFFDMNSQSQMSALGVPSTSGYDSNFTDGWDANGDGDFDDPDDWLPWTPGALEYWGPPAGYTGGTGHTVMSGEHEVSESVAPSVGSIQMYEPMENGDFDLDPVSGEYEPVAPGTGNYAKGYYHDQSDLSVITHKDGSWDAYDSSGTEVTGTLQSAGAVRVISMYDARQGGNVMVTEIDISLLNGTGLFPKNGLLYSASYGSGTGTDCRGTKMVNGSELLGPLTVVTENSMYVQGDYNTVNKRGASVIADGVNLLSNAWDDTKSPGQLPAATETTFNLAIATGNQNTVGAKYNGGLENLPRFHEKWSGVRCNIVGSFVSTWLSQQATGAWKYGGDRYTAPRRTWFYDEDFNQVANLPPFTPMAVTAREVVSW